MVTVHLVDGSKLRGSVFVGREQRLQDFLNEARDFIPFTVARGKLNLIQKDKIVRVIPEDNEKPKPRRVAKKATKKTAKRKSATS